MSFLLRKVDKRRRFVEPPPWVGDDDVRADTLKELHTKNNSLSVWTVDSDCSNLARILAAMSAGRDALQELDYALICERHIDGLSLQRVPRVGTSPDVEANEKWHEDMVDLSGRNILELALAISTRGRVERANKVRLAAWIRESIDGGFIKQENVAPRVLGAMPRYLEADGNASG